MADKDPTRTGSVSVEEMRRIFDFFIEVLIRTMALQAVMVENDLRLQDRIDWYREKLSQSEAIQKAREQLSPLDDQALSKLLQEFQGPIQ